MSPPVDFLIVTRQSNFVTITKFTVDITVDATFSTLQNAINALTNAGHIFVQLIKL